MDFKKLFKNKKVIALILVVAVVVIGIGAGIGLTMGKSSVKLNPEKIQGLIDADYTSEITLEEESKVGLNIVGNLTDEEKNELIKSLFEAGKNWSKEEVNINFFNEESAVKVVDKFYVEGLTTQVNMSYLTNTAKVGAFENIPKVDKAKALVDYNKGQVGYNDGYVTIDLDMAIKEDKAVDVVSQAKAFIVMFRDINKDNDISNVQMNINHNSNDKAYSYSTEFEDVLKNITIMKF